MCPKGSQWVPQPTSAFRRSENPFVWGPSGAKAVETAQALEIVADMAIKTLTINPTPRPQAHT